MTMFDCRYCTSIMLVRYGARVMLLGDDVRVTVGALILFSNTYTR